MTEKKDVVESILEKAKPALANFGFGTVAGYCSGLAMIKVGRALAVAVGTVFVGLQMAVAFGYIDVNWKKVADNAKAKMDVNSDGTLNKEDVKEYWRRLKTLLTHKIPSAGGFSLGFLYGVRQG
jgi:uncharacterized membrane protein (Fun14 family)